VTKKQKAPLRRLSEYLPTLRTSPLSALIKRLELANWRAGHNDGTVHTANEQVWDAIFRLPALESIECRNMSLRADYLQKLDRPTLKQLTLHDCTFPWVENLEVPALVDVDLKELDGSKRIVAVSNFTALEFAEVYEGTAMAVAFVDASMIFLQPCQLRTLKLETANRTSLGLFVKRMSTELPPFTELIALDVLVHSAEDDLIPLLTRCPNLEKLTVHGPFNLINLPTDALPRLKSFNGHAIHPSSPLFYHSQADTKTADEEDPEALVQESETVEMKKAAEDLTWIWNS
jgi:hypothetical protein